MLSERARAFSGSQTSGMRNRARQLRAEGVRIANFAAGELENDTSDAIKNAAHQAIDGQRTQYSETLGIQPLRQRLAESLSAQCGVPYSAAEVGFAAGAKQALFNAAFVAFQPGDEVIVPSPYWVTFPEQVRLAGATPVFVPNTPEGLSLDLDAIEKSITEKTRGIIINTPHNPTGTVCSAAELKRVAQLCQRHNLTCIFDQCYDKLVYPPARHFNIVALVPQMKERTIIVGSFSKTYCMAGWRAGYVAAPKEVISAMANLQSHTASNASTLVQYAALAALDVENDAFVATIRAQLLNQRDLALEGLQKISALRPDVTCTAPQGAFYLFPDVGALLKNTFRGQAIETVDVLAEILLVHAHIAVVPGTAFGSDRHIRISYAAPPEDIRQGFERFAGLVSELR